jgi:hypothetical protein|tara:strand:- start:1392 stop:1565 length:174 start_codon:yes stop_codon:yes gene_type:complete
MTENNTVKDEHRILFTRLVECARWCLDNNIVSVSELDAMRRVYNAARNSYDKEDDSI